MALDYSDIVGSVRSSLQSYADKYDLGDAQDLKDSTWEDARNLIFNDYLTEKANKQSMENWLAQQRYNSPAEQMKRFAEAGLNPNLIYSQGNAGNASSAAQVHANPTFQSKEQERKYQRIQAINSTISTVNQSLQQFLGSLSSIYGIQQQKQEIAARNLELGSMARILRSPAIADYAKYSPVYPRVSSSVDGKEVNSDKLFETDFDAFTGAIAFPSAYRSYLQDLYQTDQRSYLNTRNDIAKYWDKVNRDKWNKYGGREAYEAQTGLQKYQYDFLNQMSPAERTIYTILMQILGVGAKYFK